MKAVTTLYRKLNMRCHAGPAAEEQTERSMTVVEVVRQAYGTNEVEEKRKHTRGHEIVTGADQALATETKCSLLYGEVLPEGVDKILDAQHLDGANAKTLFDLGMGLGKLAMQAWLQFPNLEYVVGVELAQSRYLSAAKAALNLAELSRDYNAQLDAGDGLKPQYHLVPKEERGRPCKVKVTEGDRVLEFYWENFFTFESAFKADIVICETNIPVASWVEFTQFLNKLKAGCRILTYENLESVYMAARSPMPFVRLPINGPDDRFWTTWAQNSGHHFHLWKRN